MSTTPSDARIEMLLGELKLPSVKRMYRKLAKEVAQAGGDFVTYLAALLEEEIEDRRSRRVQRRLKESKLRQIKQLSELDPSALPKGISMETLQELASGAYIAEATNVIAIGNSGTGKTHVGSALAAAACLQGLRVRAYTAIELISELEAAQEEHQLHRYLARFATWDLVFVDELGYLPVTEHGADLLFQAFSERHERKSVIVTTNLPFADWGKVFQTERLAVAMLDRITHNAHILEMNGESYRLRMAKATKTEGRKKAM